MKKLKYYIVMAGVLTAILSGCENKNMTEKTEVTKEVDMTDGSKKDEKEEIESKIRTLELTIANHYFEEATDLYQDEAVYYGFILEYFLFSEDSGKGLFSEYGLTKSNFEGETVEIPIELANKMLVKYFNVEDIKLFKSRERMPSVISIDDEKVVIDNSGFGGGGRAPIVYDIALDNKSGDYVVLVDLIAVDGGTAVEEVDPNEAEDENYEYVEGDSLGGLDKDKKYKILYRDGDLLEKREYKLGRHKDGGFYFKSMKILEEHKK